ncbi:hypothetical protein [Chryseobacterium jejuense]|uniref:Uncharacterized protein n=1 Tax=Chryseobacterium jejuense TaxID=445960 RepID=A0A2X2X4S6_CHRJE|nr:hypothetical protein [Chryseobacterium jejuense]SDI51229.1 hypothetical protein SAMN05421542_1150 [Chryseobacterium jejuense]SQB46887.1 Uncharacterised protein [Chryseobacterium jejuense]
MKSAILILFLLINIFAYGQKCNYQTAVNTENLKQTGRFKLLIKNNDEKSFKISKELNLCNMRLEKFEFYNEETQTFEAAHMPKKDIDCFTYSSKAINLKPSQTYIYDINIKSDFEVLQSNKFFETFNDRKYRFKLTFSLGSYDRCRGSNTLITDWIYKN